MGMTNEEAIEWIEALVETMLHETTVGPFPDPEYRDEVYEALDMAIKTMRKYQKIEEIYKNWCYPTYFNATDAMNKLGEVLKDGNDD